jgi:hypothetical protein
MPRLVNCNLTILCWLVALLSASLWPDSKLIAQGYLFSVPEMKLEVFVQTDASARMEYTIIFQNSPGGHVIDIVDIGLPHRQYDLGNMSASVDGTAINTIQKSTYIDIGVEVHLGGKAIAPGRQGEFKFQCTMPEMVYQDTTDKTLASLQIVPTWFDVQSYQGRTNLLVAFHFPPGTDASAIRFQNEKFKYDQIVMFGEAEQKHAVVTWSYPEWPLSSSNPKLAASFPKSVMQRVVTIGPFGLFMKWFRENPSVQFSSLAILGILFAVIFFRFSHGTGFVLFFLLGGFLGITALASPSLHLLGWPAMIGLFFLNERALKRRSQQRSYLPAMATVEGGGIKRGLTAPQAAVLLEMPTGKILSLVIFGLIKKGVLEKTGDNPLTVKVLPAYKQPRQLRLTAASDNGIILHDYEHSFLDILASHEKPVKDFDFSSAVGGLIKSVANRMAGFDLSETKTYYRAIIERALKEAQSVGEVPQRDEVVDRNFEWILMDEHWFDIFDSWARNGRPYRPWWDRRRTGPVVVINHGGGSWSGGDSGNGGSTSPSTPPTSRTSMGEVAAGFAGWTENTMASLAGAIEPAGLGLDLPKGSGILDLSGVDRVTGDVFKALADAAASGKGRGGGGGGGGCACACAGCACACACAGGGR